MSAESEVWDEIYDKLVVIYNQKRHLGEQLAGCNKAKAKLEEQMAHLEAKASQYEALFAASDPQEGIPA